MLGDKLSEQLGQSHVIENNTQGAGIVAEQRANKAPRYAATDVMLTAGYAGRAALHQGLAFVALGGFSFVTGVCGYPMTYLVAPKSPISSFCDILERAKTKPHALTYTI